MQAKVTFFELFFAIYFFTLLLFYIFNFIYLFFVGFILDTKIPPGFVPGQHSTANVQTFVASSLQALKTKKVPLFSLFYPLSLALILLSNLTPLRSLLRAALTAIPHLHCSLFNAPLIIY
jgi:hypothetical protein